MQKIPFEKEVEQSYYGISCMLDLHVLCVFFRVIYV